MLKIFSKKRTKKGMTLFELLVAILIMALAFTTTVGALAMAQKSYRSISATADASTFLTENVNAIKSILRNTDVRYDITAENSSSFDSEIKWAGPEDSTAGNLTYDTVTITSLSEGYRGHFVNKNGVIQFICTTDDPSNPTLYGRGKVLAINNNMDAPLTAYIDFTDIDADERTYEFVVSIYDGTMCVASATATAIAIEKNV